MKYITVRLADIAREIIPIGYEGEQNHTQVIVYCAQIFDEYPNAAVTMVIKSGAGSVYPQAVTREGSTVIWDVTPANVAGAGGGTFQFTFTDNEEVIKSVIGTYSVNASILGSGEAPDPVADWVAEATEVLAEVEQVVIDVEGKAEKDNPVFTGSISLGRKANTTSGNNSVAEGYKVTASGMYSHAEGDETTASGNMSHAEGFITVASGMNSHAEGDKTTASAGNAHAEGFMTTASAVASHAEGGHTVASGLYSHAEGTYTIASKQYQHVFGKYNVADNNLNGKYVEIVGNGEADNARANARTLDWDGNERLKGDLYVGCNASGTGGTKAATVSDLAEKADAEDPVFTGSMSLNRTSGTSEGARSIALGNNVTASGDDTIAFGKGTVAKYPFDHVFGMYNAEALLPDEPFYSSKQYHRGDMVTYYRNGEYVPLLCIIANSSTGSSTPIAGEWIEASRFAEIVGNGSSDSYRTNARTLDWNGNERLRGNLYVGCNVDSSGGKKVATEVEVKNVSGTTPTITGVDNTRYICGEVSTISITPPSSGIIDVIFTSGTTPAVLTIPNTVKLPGWFDASSLEANTTYEINILNGVYGAVSAWT